MVDRPSTTLRAMGQDKTWLHHGIVEEPSRVGLGELTITPAERTPYPNNGGRLDMLTRAIEQSNRQVIAKALTSGKVRVNIGAQSRHPAHGHSSTHVRDRRPVS